MQSMKRIELIATAILILLVGGTYSSRAQNTTLIAQQAYIKASNTGGPLTGELGGDNFGWSVASSGDTMVIGAPGEDSNATGVNGKQTNNSARDSGAAYVLVRDGTNWVQQAYLKASNTGGNDVFGFSVAISGDTVAVGARWESSNATGVNGNQSNNSASAAGAVYVFVRSGTNWMQQAYLKASNTGASDIFGRSMAISGDTMVISAALEDSNATGVNGNQTNNSATDSGAAYVFVHDGTNWVQQAYLKASNTGAVDWFGFSVALSGDTIVIGATQEDSNATGINGNQTNNSATDSGAAYVFVRDGTNWMQQAYLKASNTGAGDNFGYSVAISGDTLVVGANLEGSKAAGVNGNQSDNSALHAGAAYVFVREGTNWSQQAYLKASNPGGLDPSLGPILGSGDEFGRSVAIFGDTVVVGAANEDGNATGVNGDQSDENAPLAGAAYVFVRSATSWSQQAYLKPSNTRTFDGFFGEIPNSALEFGISVAISGDTVVVGADGDFSNATGVNGDQSNTNATFSGAAYVFTGLGAPAPQLGIERSADNVRILWPLSAANFVVEEADDLNASPLGWSQLPFAYQTNATHVSITLPLTAENKFYRLRKP